MKTLFASLALAAVALPGAALANEGEKKACCCCETMKQDGHDCCAEKEGAKEGDHSGHGGHEGHDPAPAN